MQQREDAEVKSVGVSVQSRLLKSVGPFVFWPCCCFARARSNLSARMREAARLSFSRAHGAALRAEAVNGFPWLRFVNALDFREKS